jgi:hypothetical protein
MTTAGNAADPRQIALSAMGWCRDADRGIAVRRLVVAAAVLGSAAAGMFAQMGNASGQNVQRVATARHVTIRASIGGS